MTKRSHHKRQDWDDRLGLIETSILRGSHPITVGMSASCRVVLLGLYGLCRDLNREVIPPIFCEKNYVGLAKAVNIDVRNLRRALVVLKQRACIYDAFWMHNGNQIATIGLTGLEDKWGAWLKMKGDSIRLSNSTASRDLNGSKEQGPDGGVGFEAVLVDGAWVARKKAESNA